MRRFALALRRWDRRANVGCLPAFASTAENGVPTTGHTLEGRLPGERAAVERVPTSDQALSVRGHDHRLDGLSRGWKCSSATLRCKDRTHPQAVA
jgi:hypothetical protein